MANSILTMVIFATGESVQVVLTLNLSIALKFDMRETIYHMIKQKRGDFLYLKNERS